MRFSLRSAAIRTLLDRIQPDVYKQDPETQKMDGLGPH
jgi:hypothetical protein